MSPPRDDRRADGGAATVIRPERDGSAAHVGAATRIVSWVIDALVISVVAIIAGLGVSLVVAIVPLAHNVSDILKPVAGGAFLLWCALYFVVFWSTTGQTPGARMMQIRLVTAGGDRVPPRRALLRWIGMNLAALPLCAGYLPILFRRRGLPDWLARTLVIPAVQLSAARVRQLRLARGAPPRAPQTSPGARR